MEVGFLLAVLGLDQYGSDLAINVKWNENLIFRMLGRQNSLLSLKYFGEVLS